MNDFIIMHTITEVAYLIAITRFIFKTEKQYMPAEHPQFRYSVVYPNFFKHFKYINECGKRGRFLFAGLSLIPTTALCLLLNAFSPVEILNYALVIAAWVGTGILTANLVITGTKTTARRYSDIMELVKRDEEKIREREMRNAA